MNAAFACTVFFSLVLSYGSRVSAVELCCKSDNCPAGFPSTSSLCLTDSASLLPDKSGVTPNDQQLIVDEHNRLRGLVEPSAANMQKMYWDDNLAAVAQKWANQCQMQHDTHISREIPGYGINVGQNIAAGTIEWIDAIRAWFNEKKDFQYGGENAFHKIGHYTQVVFHNSRLVGCGFSKCTSQKYYICNYARGQMSPVNKPYATGSPCSSCSSFCSSKLCDCGKKVCYNGGTLDIKTCKCTCLKLFSGELCETKNCPSSDPSHCGTSWPKSFCTKYSNVKIDCPYMCGVC